VTTTALEARNPLLEGLPLRRRPEPCALVIFGASGDLTQRKLMPALYSLAFRRRRGHCAGLFARWPPKA